MHGEEELWQKHEREDHVEQAEKRKLDGLDLINAYRDAFGAEPLKEIDPPRLKTVWDLPTFSMISVVMDAVDQGFRFEDADGNPLSAAEAVIKASTNPNHGIRAIRD